MEAIADTLPAEGFLLRELAEEEEKTLRKPAAVLLRLAISFGLSAIIRETSFHLPTDIHSKWRRSYCSPKVLGFPTDLESASP